MASQINRVDQQRLNMLAPNQGLVVTARKALRQQANVYVGMGGQLTDEQPYISPGAKHVWKVQAEQEQAYIDARQDNPTMDLFEALLEGGHFTEAAAHINLLLESSMKNFLIGDVLIKLLDEEKQRSELEMAIAEDLANQYSDPSDRLDALGDIGLQYVKMGWIDKGIATAQKIRAVYEDLIRRNHDDVELDVYPNYTYEVQEIFEAAASVSVQSALHVLTLIDGFTNLPFEDKEINKQIRQDLVETVAKQFSAAHNMPDFSMEIVRNNIQGEWNQTEFLAEVAKAYARMGYPDQAVEYAQNLGLELRKSVYDILIEKSI